VTSATAIVLPSCEKVTYGELIDATIIAVLLPASMKLLGDWNWYLPSWLEWLPHLEAPAEGEARPERVEAPAVPAS
jgi:putative drug exporter of the RND superfamily